MAGSATAIFLFIVVGGSLAWYGKRALTDLYHSLQEATLDQAAELFAFRNREVVPQPHAARAAAYNVVQGVPLNTGRHQVDRANLV